MCVLEGPDLLEAALASDAEFEALYVGADASTGVERSRALAEAAGVRIFTLAPEVLERIADATTPQPLLAVVRLPVRDVALVPATGLILVLHDVRDPGNAGTIIRSADAAGATAVILTGQSVDPTNPKTLRATAGSIFHLPVAVAELDLVLGHFAGLGMSTYATVVRGGQDVREIDLTVPSLVVIGNESQGLDESSIAACGQTLTIPMAGRSESLNAGVAASLIAFEALWQHQDAAAAASRRSLEGL